MNKWENQGRVESKRKEYLDEKGIKIILIEKIKAIKRMKIRLVMKQHKKEYYMLLIKFQIFC